MSSAGTGHMSNEYLYCILIADKRIFDCEIMVTYMCFLCRNEIVESAKAGDKIVFTGTVAVLPDVSGFSR